MNKENCALKLADEIIQQFETYFSASRYGSPTKPYRYKKQNLLGYLSGH